MKLEEKVAVSVPGSKSIAIRVLIIATFFNTSLKIYNLPDCNDVVTMVEALKKLGYEFDRGGDKVTVTPPKTANSPVEIDIKDSAAALRFLTVRLASWEGFEGIINLSSQLVKRPVKPLIDLITAMGGDIKQEEDKLIIRGKRGLRFDHEMTEYLASDITSQLLSAVLLSSPAIDVSSNIKGMRSVSHSYVTLTVKIMKDLGLDFESNSVRRYSNPQEYDIEPDYSSACYFWALGCILKRPVGVYCTPKESLQPDFRFLDVLEQMGAKIEWSEKAIYVSAEDMKTGKIDMNEMPDQVPTLAVLTLLCCPPESGEAVLYNIGQLRYKESDRINALVTELPKLGADIEYEAGVLKIRPLKSRNIPEVTLNCYQDHRLVMAFSLIQEVYPQVRITDKGAVKKSFPGFFEAKKILSTNSTNSTNRKSI